MLRSVFIVILTLIMIGLAQPSTTFAKAAFKSKEGMILSADLIALVEIISVKPVKVKGKAWTYRQEALARPVQIIKGVPKYQYANTKSSPGELTKADSRDSKSSRNSDKSPRVKVLRLLGDENFECAQVKFKPGKALVFLNREANFYRGNNWGLSSMPVARAKIETLEWFSQGLKRSPRELKSVISEIKQILNQGARKAKVPSYLKPLTKATKVTDEQVGEGGESSKDYALYARALKDRTLEFNSLNSHMKSSTPSGKIYFAMLIMKHFPEQAKPTLTKLLGDKSSLEVQSGCEIMDYTVSSAVRELLDRGKLIMLSY